MVVATYIINLHNIGSYKVINYKHNYLQYWCIISFIISIKQQELAILYRLSILEVQGSMYSLVVMSGCGDLPEALGDQITPTTDCRLSGGGSPASRRVVEGC